LSGVLTSVTVDTKDTFSTGAPQPLFQTRGRAAISATDHFSYDVAGDGKHFLVNQYVKPNHIKPFTLLLLFDHRVQKNIVPELFGSFNSRESAFRKQLRLLLTIVECRFRFADQPAVTSRFRVPNVIPFCLNGPFYCAN